MSVSIKSFMVQTGRDRVEGPSSQKDIGMYNRKNCNNKINNKIIIINNNIINIINININQIKSNII